MLLPINWLKDYIDIDKNPREIADALTYSGSHVESIIEVDRGIENIVVGKINKIEPHENADKLVVCTVDIGDEELIIVTGAKNLTEGDYVPVALVGAKLSNGIEIGLTNFRGIDSYGMLISLEELGFNDSVIPKEVRDGIFIFDKAYELGSDAIKILGLDDYVIEFEITPNRPDCLSMIGMAREAAATMNTKLNEPELIIKEEVDDVYDYANGIEIKTDHCIRYYSKVIKDVKVGQSPLWLQTYLMKAGMRPVNNIVDITNFVMLEYGEPLHAFDLDDLEGRKVIVRQAEEGEILTTLDGVERKLDRNDVVIADAKEPIGIAGVMGGLDSEITEKTTTILLEGANFNSKSVRLSSKKFGLRTEASTRFEKGIDPNICNKAVDRVCQLIEQIGAGTVVANHIDIYKEEAKTKDITLRPERANMLLGIEIEPEQMVGYLNSLGIESKIEDHIIQSIAPTFRLDLNIEADLIEEIGRLYGFHNIEKKPLVGALTRGTKPNDTIISNKVKTILTGMGLNEVMTYSFISPKAYDKINMKEDHYIRLMNPLGEDYSVMRTTLIPNMMDLLSNNINKGIDSVYAYEIGSIFLPKQLPVEELPEERKVLSLGLYGDDVDFYFLKDIVESMLIQLGIKELSYVREENNNVFHSGRTANILAQGEVLGTIGEIHPDVSENYDVNERIYIGSLDFERIIKLTNLERKYKNLPKYPAMTRDIALTIDEDILVGDIEDVILKHGKELIEDIALFDIYRGDQIEKGKKSVAFTIVYRSYERTLTDDEINKIQELIINDLESSFDAKLRS